MILNKIKKNIQSFVEGFLNGFDNQMEKLGQKEWSLYVRKVARRDVIRGMKLDALRPTGLFPKEINPFLERIK